MLVLSRKTEEKIQIGDNITVTVLRVQGNKIRLGIEAPTEVRVLRGELNPRAQDVPATKPRQSVDTPPTQPTPQAPAGQLSSRARAIVARMVENSARIAKSEVAG